MILSMTGFGAGKGQSGEEEISVSLRSVNHKFCEVKARLPYELAPLEAELVRQVKDGLARGAIEASVRRTAGGGRSATTAKVDLELARQYVSALNEAADALSLPRNLGTAELARIEGLVQIEARALDVDAARAAMKQATEQAIKAMVAMREREGKALAQDLLSRVASIREAAKKVAELSPASIEHYRERLEARVAELSRGVAVDPQRLAQEVALFADKVDIAEELTRLESHLEQLEQLVHGSEPAGRRMDFLVQELHREVNTTGSKSQSAEIAQLVVGMKAEVERIREQVQNVE